MIDGHESTVSNEAAWELRVQVPPGWIELVAHEDDHAMLSALDNLLGPHLSELTAADVSSIRAQFTAARRLTVSSGMRVGGAVLTAWDERATAWMYGVWVVPVESPSGVNPVGLIERVLGVALAGGSSRLASLFTEGRQEDFEMLGGRVGSSLYATVDASRLAPPSGFAALDLPPAAGVVLAAVPMPGVPTVAALVMGAAPSVEERGAMAVFASAMAHSAHLLVDGDPDEVTLVDLTVEEAFGWIE